MRRNAFTLIEMMTVIIILALLAGAAALSFARPLAASRARNAIDQVISLDSSSREFATRFARPTAVVFDLSGNTIARRDRDDTAFQFALPSNVRIEEVRIGSRAETSGEVEVAIAPRGLSRSYAVHLVGTELDQWLMFAGLGGHVSQVNDVSQVEQLLNSSAQRDDAD